MAWLSVVGSAFVVDDNLTNHVHVTRDHGQASIQINPPSINCREQHQVSGMDVVDFGRLRQSAVYAMVRTLHLMIDGYINSLFISKYK